LSGLIDRRTGFNHIKDAGAKHLLWQSEDGHLALFLANYTEKETPFSYNLDPARYGLTADRFELTEILPGTTVSLGRAGPSIKRTETMPPNKVRVIEIAPQRH